MNNNYIIPANTKKSQLILGFFTMTDLILFVIGCFWTLAMLLFVPGDSLLILILKLMPGLIGGFLVMPVPHYHNILQLLTNLFNYFMNPKKYYWRGWCANEEFNRNNK